jgi:hypothetical protein
MKLPVLALSALLLVPAGDAVAQHGHRHGPVSISIDDDGHHGRHDSPARPGPRRSPREARAFITTTDNVASLLLTRDVLAMQLTDRTLARIARDADEDTEEHGFIGRLVSNVVRNTVTNVLRRSLEIPIDEVRSVEYRGGRMLITTEDGERIFSNVEVNDSDVMENFARRDAEAFVRAFHAAKARR